MKKSHKIITSLAALGALCVGTAAMAQPWADGTPCPRGYAAECLAGGPQAGATAAEVRAARWAAVERMLTIKPEQQAAWKAYVEASDALRTPIETKTVVADEQTRLERRAERAKIRADQLAKKAAVRAELLKVLSPEQKYVLEGMEFHHGRRGAHHGQGFGPGPHHGWGHGYGPAGNPGCPLR